MQTAWKIHAPDSDFAANATTILQLKETAQFFRELAEHYKGMALHDELTGLPNRHATAAYIDGILSAVAERNKQFTSNDGFLIAMCDVDKFKSINDTLGHDAGDAALVEFSKRLETSVRRNESQGVGRHKRHYDDYGIYTDLLARHGGEEFLLILPMPVYSHPNVVQVAERVYNSVAGIYDLGQERTWPMSISLGVNFISWLEIDEFVRGFDRNKTLTGKSTDMHKFLFDHADTASYAAKNTGRARACFWDKTVQEMTTIFTYQGPVSDAVIASRN